MRPGLANARGEQGGDYVPSSKSWVWRLDDTVVEGFRPTPEVYGEGRREVVGRVEVVEDRSGSEEVKDTSKSFTFLPVPSPAPQSFSSTVLSPPVIFLRSQISGFSLYR